MALDAMQLNTIPHTFSLTLFFTSSFTSYDPSSFEGDASHFDFFGVWFLRPSQLSAARLTQATTFTSLDKQLNLFTSKRFLIAELASDTLSATSPCLISGSVSESSALVCSWVVTPRHLFT